MQIPAQVTHYLIHHCPKIQHLEVEPVLLREVLELVQDSGFPNARDPSYYYCPRQTLLT